MVRGRFRQRSSQPWYELEQVQYARFFFSFRIGDLGAAGEVIVSDSVRQLAAGKGFTFDPAGEVSLKGFDEPERVWKVTQTTST